MGASLVLRNARFGKEILKLTTQKNAMVSVDHLNKVYESKERRVEAIGDLSFEVNQGDFTCIVGPSGAGKTTLLKCLAGLLKPTAGSVRVNGREVTEPPEEMEEADAAKRKGLWDNIREKKKKI
mgnify:CR=1 FL=1